MTTKELFSQYLRVGSRGGLSMYMDIKLKGPREDIKDGLMEIESVLSRSKLAHIIANRIRKPRVGKCV